MLIDGKHETEINIITAVLSKTGGDWCYKFHNLFSCFSEKKKKVMEVSVLSLVNNVLKSFLWFSCYADILLSSISLPNLKFNSIQFLVSSLCKEKQVSEAEVTDASWNGEPTCQRIANASTQFTLTVCWKG